MTENYIIHETTNYEQFRFSKLNRGIDPKHLSFLVAAIGRKNLLSEYPIVVNADLIVLDGQHRLKAATLLSTPIYYIVSERMLVEDVGSTNNTTKRWMFIDYLEHYASKGLLDYITIKEFYNEYSWMTPSCTIGLLYYGDVARNNAVSLFRSGNFRCNNLASARLIASACLDFVPYVSFYGETVFVSTVRNLLSNVLYDHKRMMRKMKYVSSKLRKCVDVASYVECVNEIYNYKESEADRVELKKIVPGSQNWIHRE